MRNIFYSSLICLLFLTGCSQKEIVKDNNEMALKSETSVNVKNDFIHELALHDAIRAKDFDIVKELVSNGMAIDTKDKYGFTPLHLAARLNQYESAELLLEKGANVNNIDSFKDTPLLDSTRNSTNPMSRLLLCNGADRNIADRHQMLPLHNASKNNDLYIVEMIESKNIQEMCGKLDITLDEYIEDENKICGSIVKGLATNVDLTIIDEDVESKKEFGKYEADIDAKKYCAELDKPIEKNKNYLVTAVGTNSIDTDIEVANIKDLIKEKELPISPMMATLYDDLMKEFKNDFEPWNAELDKNGLVFRFKKPEVLFTHGSSKLSSSYAEILEDFFPRYLNIINKYRDEISAVKVEGHTSSVYSSAKSDEERYSKNLRLSQKRANAVHSYTNSLDSEIVTQSNEWLNNYYVPQGMGYEDLIYDENGKEDEILSRRVEFRINQIVK